MMTTRSKPTTTAHREARAAAAAALASAQTLEGAWQPLLAGVWAADAGHTGEPPKPPTPAELYDLVAPAPDLDRAARAAAVDIQSLTSEAEVAGPVRGKIQALLVPLLSPEVSRPSPPLTPEEAERGLLTPDAISLRVWRWRYIGRRDGSMGYGQNRQQLVATAFSFEPITDDEPLQQAFGVGLKPFTENQIHKLWYVAHAEWEAGARLGQQPKHPLAPLMLAWIQAQPVEPYQPVQRASLPRVHRTSSDDAQRLGEAELPSWWITDTPAPPQPTLPGFEPDVDSRCPSWLLALYDRAGGESLSQGRGAPWDLRLFVGAMLHLHVGDRDGEWHRLAVPQADVVSWLHPRGWANRRRDWRKLPAALRSMSGLYVPVPGVGDVLLCVASVIPRTPQDPGVEFTVRVPPSAAAGVRIDWPRLCQYGTESASLYRAYLSVCSVLDHSARRGHPITRQIAAPVLGVDGKPTRRRGGGIVRDPDVLIPNPAARYVPMLSDHDTARFVGFDAASKQRRHDARRALERLEADGVIKVDPAGGGRFRIFAPETEKP